MLSGTMLGPYRIEAKLGEGGMGEVYKARDTRLDRTIAIKVLPTELSTDRGRRARFEREAKTIAGLSHPHICTLHDVGEHEGAMFLVMELLQGETLADRLAKGRLPLDQALTIATEIAEALAAAHREGIIHRDLKPGNVMLTTAGTKLLDFGLAKAVGAPGAQAPGLDGDAATVATMAAPSDDSGRTSRGVVVGTVSYMSPEQVEGEPLDARSDIFSFGAVLYEMLSGQRAFHGDSPVSTMSAILRDTPAHPGRVRAGVPHALDAILDRCLQKKRELRYASGAELHGALMACQSLLAAQKLGTWAVLRKPRVAVPAVALIGVLLVAVSWFIWQSSRQRWALEVAVPEITRLVDAGEYVKAAALARDACAVRPKDSVLEKLWTLATGEVSLASVPPGADVSIRPYRGGPNAWQPLGQTPLKKVRVPRDTYVWRMVKPGFAPVFYIGEPPGGMPAPGFRRNPFDLTWTLRPQASVPPEMVVVSGGMVRLGFPLVEAPVVQVGDFLIDRHEVTNEEYKKFVDAGGYQKREFWKQPFVRDGHTIPWEAAIALLHDATGRPGPATWEAGGYPKGHGKYPVAGVSWYEAAAYAEFAGKSLPTAYHWTRAAQSSGVALAQSAGFTPVITPGSNFRPEGTQPVGSETALSGFGTTDMAGNVKEWCVNEARGATRLILGGGFGEPAYMFNNTDARSPWDRSANSGFRCVKLDAPATAAAAAHVEVTVRDYSKEKPVPEHLFTAYAGLYAYDKGELNAQIEDSTTTESWSRARVTFDAAYGHERVPAYLFLPTSASPPFQVLVYFPGAIAFMDDKLDLSDVEDTRGFLVKSGRALIFPICKGMYERRDGFVPGQSAPALHRDHVIAWAQDLGRTLDYLESRKDIDASKVAYFGDSLGGIQGAIQPVVEKRIKVAILSSGGLSLTYHPLPQADPVNFVTHVTIPVLMLNGRYDGTFPLESSQRPFFQFLGTPAQDKKHVVYEGGHGAFPRPDAVRECLDWLDKYLGPVRR